MAKRLVLLLIILGFVVQPAFGLRKYGDAVVKRGKLTVVRDGETLMYQRGNDEIQILRNDVLRVGKRSLVILKTIENTTLRMGSNAVFQVRPWKQRKKHGYLRMLFGKLLFKTKKQKDKNRFRFKTATATIGIKGTIGLTEVDPSANTQLASYEGIPILIGVEEEEQEIGAGNVSFVMNGNSATEPIEVDLPDMGDDDDTGGDDSGGNLDKPPANLPESMSLSFENLGVNVVFTEGQLRISRQGKTNVDEGFESGAGIEDLDVDSGDPEFEDDMTESEDEEEVVVIIAKKAEDDELGTDILNFERLLDEVNDAEGDGVTGSLKKTGRVNIIFDK